MEWNYAELSKAAKAAGGPEALTELLVQSGKNQMVPWIALMGLSCLGLGMGLTKIVEFFKARKRLSDQAVERARREIITGINEYDAKFSEDSEDVED